MTQDEILQMAIDSQLLDFRDDWKSIPSDYADSLYLFAELVTSKERKACAQIARDISDKYAFGYSGNEVDTADEIAAAIRARNAKHESKSTS